MSILSFLKKDKSTPHCAAVIVAAGNSERMGTDKLFSELESVPVIVRTLLAFQQSSVVDDIIVVTRMDKIGEMAELCKKYGISKAAKVISGGATRMESALAGVSAVKGRTRLIAIHDGARPLVTGELIERVVTAAAKHMSAAPAIDSTDTLKAVDDSGIILGTVDRSHTVRIQTPQVFDADLIKGALTKAVKDSLTVTDDCSAVEQMGVKTYTVKGDPNNIKLTTPDDMVLAKSILADRGDTDAYRAWV